MDRGRLQRGRRYARKGQVLSLTEGTGEVTGKVQGSRKRPYTITIQIKPLSDKQWEQVIEALANRPIFMAQLLAGVMPQDIEEAFADCEAVSLPHLAGFGAGLQLPRLGRRVQTSGSRALHLGRTVR